jgi:(R)-2-hydroxyisocaproyl-CoA dehydratase beta subunit
MKQLQSIITELESAGLDPIGTVKKAMEQSKKPAVGCFPYYTPDELIYAAGCIPVGLWGGHTEIKLADTYLQSFCCSIMRENVEQGLRGYYDFLSAIIIPAYCDTLKCICENWKVAVPQIPLIPMVYPQNRKIQAGIDYLVSEFKRVQEILEELFSIKITEANLAVSYALYEEYRKIMREFTNLAANYPVTINARTRQLIIKAGFFMDKKDYVQKIQALCQELIALPHENFIGKRVVFTGIMAEPTGLLDIFAQNNVAIVADDLADSSRQFRLESSRGMSVYEKMSCRIADQCGCSLLFDDKKERGQLLIDLVKKTGADGVVVAMMKFCDPEEFDYPIYKKELEAANIPILYLEIEQKMDSLEQIRTRVQSFIEMLD